MTDFKEVSMPELKEWLAAYPRKLERNVTTICEPPNINYNDFERAPYWPDSVVASYMDGADTASILVDINSPVEDDGKRDTDAPLFDKNGREVREGDHIRANWGWDYDFTCEKMTEKWLEDIAIIRDKGTKYERWSFTNCHNRLRGFTFEVIDG